MNKTQLRRLYLDKRKSLDPIELQEKNRDFYNLFINSQLYLRSQHIFSFLSFSNEIDTHRIIIKALEDGKHIYVPVTIPSTREMKISRLRDFKDLELGEFNILAPKKDAQEFFEPEILDLILVPGLVFDLEGYRIGYGGGYYDNFLRDVKKNTINLGISFNFQVISDKLPKDDFDIPVDYIMTDKKLIKC